jgi:hypothetical protein
MRYDDINQLPKRFREQAKKKLAEAEPGSEMQRNPAAKAKTEMHPANPDADKKHWTEKAYGAAENIPKYVKYKNRKTTVDGHTFDSKGEAERYRELKALENAGIISELQLQPEFTLMEPFRNNQGKHRRAIKYQADFQYYEADTDACVVEDFKGYKTPAFRIKQKLFENQFPEIWLRIINRKGEVE